MDQWTILHGDVKEIKGHVLELVKKAEVHNMLLKEHEKRSIHLEDRFKPIEEIYIFAAKTAATLSIVGGIAGMIYAIAKTIEIARQ